MLIRLVGPKVESLGLQHLATHLFPRRGMNLWGIPIQPTRAALQIEGSCQVETVVVANVTPKGEPIPGSSRNVDVDLVCIAGGLYPLIELANSVGCATAFSADLGGHVPIYNEHYETIVTNIFATGNMIGIEGAEVAIAQGKAAGWAIAYAALGDASSLERFANAEEEVASIRKHANIKFIPTIERGRHSMRQLWHRHLSEQDESHV
jgi:sarcosine oxidase subunit alpha